jgi:hypothetical protein
MTKKVWISTLVCVALAAAILLPAMPSRALNGLRSQHAQPARHLPARMVAVTPAGKLFHDPHCAYIHGKTKMMTADEAVKRGYTPCTRCMQSALH